MKYLNAHFNNIIEITTEDLRNYIYHLKIDHNYKNSSLVRRIGFLRRFYDFLKEEGFRNDNPAESLKFPRVKEKPIPFISESVVRRILEATDNTRDALIIKLLFYEGLRKGELLKLKKCDLHFKSNQIRINGKGNKIRILPLHKNLKKDLGDYVETMGEETYLFPLHYRYLSQLLEIIGDKLGIHLYPHLLRHSFAVNLYKRTKNVWLVSKMLGHSKLETTVKYLRSLNAIDDFSDEYQTAFDGLLS